MVRYNTLLLLLLFSVLSSSGQIIFQKTYGGTSYAAGYSVQQTNDGGYIVTGEITFAGVQGNDVYLVKTDDKGDTLWTKTYGGTGEDIGYSVEQTNDSGYIIAGYTTSFGSGGADVYLIKTNSTGHLQWAKTYGGTGDETGYSVKQTNDSGFIIAGTTKSFGEGNDDVYLIKTDNAGNEQWAKTYGGIYDDIGYSVNLTNDSGYIITGWTSSFGAGGQDVYLLKTDANGIKTWNKTYGGTEDERGYSTQQTADGGYIIGGWTRSFNADSTDIYLIKTDQAGDTLWTKKYGGTGQDFGLSVSQTGDSGYIITGSTTSFGSGLDDIYHIKTTANGDLTWSETYGTPAHEAGVSLPADDGGYIIAGYTISSDAGYYSIYLIKTDALGYSGCNEITPATTVAGTATQVGNPATIVSAATDSVLSSTPLAGSGGIVNTFCSEVGIQEATQNDLISIFPDPVQDALHLGSLANVGLEQSNLVIYNMLGEKVVDKEFKSNDPIIRVNTLSAGLYLLYITKESNRWIGKFVKE